MELITIESQIEKVAERWQKQYSSIKWQEDPEKMAITKKLLALDTTTATAKDIESIIGNDSWACPQECNECGNKYDVVIQLGEEPNYDSITAYICEGCLQKAIKLIRRIYD